VPDGDLLGADEDVLDEQPQYPLAFLSVAALSLGHRATVICGDVGYRAG
jgi:hypothetical protein